MNNRNLYIVLPLFMLAACSPRQEHEAFKTINPKIVEAKGYVVPRDSLAEPRIVPVGRPKIVKVGIPRVINTNANVHPVGKLRMVEAATPKVCIPGKDGYLLPETSPAIHSSFAAGIPSVIAAKDAYSKEINPQNFSSIGKRQGLTHGHINCMLQDKTGNIWIGTEGGLTKYDGRFFTHYTKKEGLGENEVWSILLDRNGNLWIGTYGQGISRLDRGGKRFTQFTTGKAMNNYSVKCMVEDQKGNIWFGTDIQGAYRLDREGQNFTHFTTKEGLNSNEVNALFEDNSGNIWFGTKSGASEYDGDGFTWYTVKEGLGNDVVNSIAEDVNRNMWFGTSGGGLTVIGHDRKNFTYYSVHEGMTCNDVRAILVDKNGNFWLGTDGGGACKLSMDRKIFTSYTVNEGLGNNFVSCILEDINGSIWFGTKGAGVSKHEGKLFTHYTSKEGLHNVLVWSVLEDRQGNLWIGTESGVSRLDPDRLTFRQYAAKEGFSDKPVYCITEDKSGNLWFATLGDGVIQLDREGRKFTHFTEKEGLNSNNNRSIWEDKNGNLWIGAMGGDTTKYEGRFFKYEIGGGVTKYDGHFFTNYSVKEGLSDNTVRPVLEDRQGNLWFGTNSKGVTRLDRDGKTFTHFTEKEGLIHNSVHSMMEDRDGNLWFCTMDGICKLDCDGRYFTHYTEKEGLSHHVVLSCLEDGPGNLWFGTRFGLSKLIFSDNAGERERFFKTYTFEDGFSGVGVLEGAMAKDRQGVIWVGANDRLTAYHPEGDIPDTIGPGIQLTNLALFSENIPWSVFDINKDTTITLGNGVQVSNIHFDSLSDWYFVPENLSLPHNNNFLTFNFVGITHRQSQNVRYCYKLESFDENWSTLTNRTDAPYGNLPPGTYTFKVKAMNSDGYWSKELNYTFTIRPPWFKTIWFRALSVIFILFVLIVLHSWRTASLRRRKKQLEKIVERRTKELVRQKEEVLHQKKSLEATLDKLKQTQSQLIQSEKMASLGMLTAGIAHEINNPVNFINSGAISLEKDYEDLEKIINAIDNFPPEAQKLASELGLDELMKVIPQTIEDIKTGVQRTSEIVKGLRNFTRLDASGLKEADLHEGIDSALLLLSHRIKDRIRIVKDYDQQIGNIKCYPGPLNQVFMNLLNNAVDAIDQKIKEDTFKTGTMQHANGEGGYQIKIATNLYDEANEKKVKILISDNGAGIQEEFRERVFDPFFTTKEVGKGTGLGLSICHGIIEKHGGSITFKSVHGEGTDFIITLSDIQ